MMRFEAEVVEEPRQKVQATGRAESFFIQLWTKEKSSATDLLPKISLITQLCVKLYILMLN